MAEYKISGVWKKDDGVITAYAFHTKTEKGHTRAKKTSKAEAIRLLEIQGNTAYTWIWNYTTCFWQTGEQVSIVNGANGKFLRSHRDGTTRDNLDHLIDYDWIEM